ncbi:MAG: FAD:protein FMN transferase [Candidatus Brocadiales bacterium]|nr:FAD:protein FMN transferase [Candidatus Brocadiales bacterium]
MFKNKSIKKALIILLFLLYIGNLFAAGKKEEYSPDSAPESRSELLLGTVCKITIYDNPTDIAFDAAFKRIIEIEQQMSLTIADSNLSQLNKNAGIVETTVPAETFEVIKESIEIAGLSGGAFDPSIGPIVSAWGIGTDNARVPSQDEILQLLPLVNYRDITLNTKSSTVFLNNNGMILDLGGIAKGYAADEVREELLNQGVRSAIINLGGNILTVGTKSDGSLWKIGIQDPAEDRGAYVMILSIKDTAVVTSGPYERFFTVGDTSYHHIIDTKTGYPVKSDLESISIISGNSFVADALSTAVYSLGLEAGMKLIEKMDSIEAVAMTYNHEIILSSGFLSGKIQYELTDKDFSIITLEKYLVDQ